MPFKKLVFLDLDVWLRRNPSELFQISAPAGMHHGTWSFFHKPAHGEHWPSEAYHNSCVNAGLMRLDPPKNSSTQVVDMVEEVQTIRERDASALPEQYYLVGRLKDWHHINVTWNCEVFQCLYANKCTSSKQWGTSAWSDLPKAWWGLGRKKRDLRENVNMFHFSGTYLKPWWYLYLLKSHTLQDSEAIIDSEFYERDRRGLIGLAVREWLEGVTAVQQEFANCTKLNHFIGGVISSLAKDALLWRQHCPHCQKHVWELWGSPWSKKTEDEQAFGTCCEECAIRLCWQ